MAVDIQDKKRSVLILDDNSDFRKMAADMLSMKGFSVIACTADPNEALKLIENFTPNVVLFDIVLSKIDGIAFLKAAIGNDPNNHSRLLHRQRQHHQRSHADGSIVLYDEAA